jgi:hypothetical protein
MAFEHYREHEVYENAGALQLAHGTLNGKRLVWVGSDGVRGRWLTLAEFRQLVQDVMDFAGRIGPDDAGVQPSAPDLLRRVRDALWSEHLTGLPLLEAVRNGFISELDAAIGSRIDGHPVGLPDRVTAADPQRNEGGQHG